MGSRMRIGACFSVSLLAVLAGCAGKAPKAAASNPSPGIISPATPDVPGIAELAEAARTQRSRPVAATRTLPPPPGISPELLASLAPTSEPRALLDLETVLAEFAGEEAAVPPRPLPDEEQSVAAARAYIAGRQKLLGSDADGAITELKAAIALDPGAGELWRELGEAQIASGARAEGLESLQKAESAGVHDARTLDLLGRAAAEKGDHEKAARLFARAIRAAPEQADPLLPLVLDYSAARTLSHLGFHTAAKEALLRVVVRSPVLTSTSRYMQEFGAIYRRQSDLWREVGDIEMRLDRPGAALAAYEQAALLPSLDGESPVPRLVFAAMRSGRPASAAGHLLIQVADNGGRVSPEELDLLRHVALVEGTRRQLAAALAQYRLSLGTVPPSTAASLTRAQAAIARPPEARKILLTHLAANPRDFAAAEGLLASQESIIGVVVDAASAQPLAAAALAEGVLRGDADPAAVVGSLLGTGRPEAALVAAWIELKRGFPSTALGFAMTVPIEGALAGPAALARAEMALTAGSPRVAYDLLDVLGGADPGTIRARAIILAMLQRDAAALELVGPLLEAPGTPPSEQLDNLLLASQLAITLERPGDAERWLREAASLDAGDDRALGLLADLYGPEGELADPTRLAPVIRDLRQNHADGHALRIARVQELARRSLFAQAENEALRLALENPADKAPLQVLATIWERRGRSGGARGIEHGLAWIRSRLERRPADPLLMAAQVTLMVAADRAPEAEVVVRQALSAGGGPDLSRLLERLLRDHLDDAEEAYTLALGRLERRERTVAESLELADTYVRLERAADAAGALRVDLTPMVTLRPEQQARLLILAGAVSQPALKSRAENQPKEADEAAGGDLLALAIERGITLPPELHQMRLMLLTLAPEPSPEALLAACDLAVSALPDRSAAVYASVSQLLTQNGHGAAAREFISRAATRAAPAAPALYIEWFRVVALTGTADDVRALIAALEGAGKLREIVEQFRRESEEVGDYRAEAAYLMGNFFTALQRPEEAVAAYELTLEYQPDHAWAANNLGYYLADQNRDLERAASLLERAHEALPDEPAIVDSLGWLRYKQGIIHDELDPVTGEVVRAGAVTLLQTAATTDHGQSDPTILDHLGDAQWLAGRAQDAQRSWSQAHGIATTFVQAMAQAVPARREESTEPPSEESAQLAEYRAIVQSCAAKRLAATRGQPVRVAPWPTDPDPQPRPRAGAPIAGDPPENDTHPEVPRDD